MRIALLIALAAVMLLVMVLSWGSIGSAVMAFGLISMVSALLIKRFLIDRDEDRFQDE